jgi:hypothetical protein
LDQISLQINKEEAFHQYSRWEFINFSIVNAFSITSMMA